MFARHLVVMCVIGTIIDSLVLSVMEEHGTLVRIVLFRQDSNLLRSTIWKISGLLVVFRIFTSASATSLSVSHHWLGILQWLVEM